MIVNVCMGFFFIVMGLVCMAYLILGVLHFLDLLGFIDLQEIRERNRFHKHIKDL